jgi:cytochrome c oxidase subunit II
MSAAIRVVQVVVVVFALTEQAASAETERVIHSTAKKFEFSPSVIELKVGEPVTLEIRSLDRRHGFESPDLHLDAEVMPGQPTILHLRPDRLGTFSFHCNVFCGDGHEDMVGQIVVKP